MDTEALSARIVAGAAERKRTPACAGDAATAAVVEVEDLAAHPYGYLRVEAAAARIPVVIHCFGYGKDEARAFLAAGCYLSFAGNLTYKKSADLREACIVVPDDRLLLETDAPYMNPEPARGEPSSPFDIGRTYAAVSALRGCGPESLAALVTANARAVFC